MKHVFNQNTTMILKLGNLSERTTLGERRRIEEQQDFEIRPKVVEVNHTCHQELSSLPSQFMAIGPCTFGKITIPRHSDDPSWGPINAFLQRRFKRPMILFLDFRKLEEQLSLDLCHFARPWFSSLPSEISTSSYSVATFVFTLVILSGSSFR